MVNEKYKKGWFIKFLLFLFFQEHDSFRAFRSQNLNLEISMDTKPKRDNTLNVPSCLFYASTLKFLDKIGVNKCVYLHFI